MKENKSVKNKIIESMSERYLMEAVLSLKEDNVEELIKWCEEHSIFTHNEENEFLFWVPPFDEYANYIKETYGENIPEKIYEMIFQMVVFRSKEDDAGYLLIAFV